MSAERAWTHLDARFFFEASLWAGRAGKAVLSETAVMYCHLFNCLRLSRRPYHGQMVGWPGGSVQFTIQCMFVYKPGGVKACWCKSVVM